MELLGWLRPQLQPHHRSASPSAHSCLPYALQVDLLKTLLTNFLHATLRLRVRLQGSILLEICLEFCGKSQSLLFYLTNTGCFNTQNYEHLRLMF